MVNLLKIKTSIKRLYTNKYRSIPSIEDHNDYYRITVSSPHINIFINELNEHFMCHKINNTKYIGLSI